MIRMESNVYVVAREASSGLIVARRRARNLVVNTGLQLARDLLGGTGFRPDTMQVGTDTSATSASTTALGNTVATKTIERRVEQTYGIEFQALLGTADANGYSLAEVGTLEGSTLLARALISPAIAKTALLQVTLSHIITFTAG